MLGKSRELDLLVDKLPSRETAHLVEEAIRHVLRQKKLRAGLWRYRGTDTALIQLAVKCLNSWAPEGKPPQPSDPRGAKLR